MLSNLTYQLPLIKDVEFIILPFPFLPCFGVMNESGAIQTDSFQSTYYLVYVEIIIDYVWCLLDAGGRAVCKQTTM